jgi:hypothetical protein
MVYIKGGNITDNGVGVLITHGPGSTSPVTIDGTNIARNARAGIQIEEVPDYVALLRLKDSAAGAALLPLLAAVKAGELSSREELVQQATAAGAEQYLAATANLATLADGIFKLRDSGALDAAIRYFLG